MSSSTQKPGLSPSLFSRVTKTFVGMMRRTDPIVQEAVRKQILQDPPAAAPAPESEASAPAPQEKTAVEILLEQALKEAIALEPATKHIVYTDDQLATVEMRLPRPKADYIVGLSKLHNVSVGSIINGLLERTPMGDLTHIAITLREAHRECIQAQVAKLTQTPKQPQGDQP